VTRRAVSVLTVALLSVSVVGGPGLPITAVAAATPTPTSIVLEVTPNPVHSGDSADLYATVTPSDSSYGVNFWYSRDGGAEQLLTFEGVYGGVAHGYFFPSTQGTFTIRAELLPVPDYAGSWSDPVEVEVTGQPTTLNVSFDRTIPVAPTAATVVVASPHGIPDGGTIEIHDVTGGGDDLLAAGPLTYLTGPDYGARLDLGGRAEGTYDLEVRYSGTDTYAAAVLGQSLVVARGTSTTYVVGPGPTQLNHAAEVQASVATTWGTPSGSITFAGSSNGGPVATYATVPLVGNLATTAINGLPLGTTTVTATWSGDDSFAGSTSDPVDIPVVSDVVEASNVGVSATTFYPIKDGYRDSVKVRGTRYEPIRVSIKIYSPAGRLVKSVSIGGGTGPYGYSWTGKSIAGSLLPAGKYKVLQSLTDAAGMNLKKTSYVSLSRKRLVTHTTYIYKTARQYKHRTAQWIGWQFTLPSATVYKGLSFGVYGKSTLVPGGNYGAWNVNLCSFSASWDPGCVSPVRDIGFSVRWYQSSFSPTNNRSGHYVRGFAFAGYGGAAAVSRARLKVVYGVLR